MNFKARLAVNSSNASSRWAWLWSGVFAGFWLFFLTLRYWDPGYLDAIFYPLRLFSTMVHEGGHALTAWLTGGEVHELVLNPDGSGHVVHSGGWTWLVSFMGYLGVGLVSCVLIRAVLREWSPTWTVGMLGVLMVGCAWWSLAFSLQAVFTLVWAVVLASVCIGVAWKSKIASHVLLCLLAARLHADGVYDLLQLSTISTVVGAPNISSDAQNMANATGIPSLFWAWLWLAILMVMTAWAFGFGGLLFKRSESPAR